MLRLHAFQALIFGGGRKNNTLHVGYELLLRHPSGDLHAGAIGSFDGARLVSLSECARCPVPYRPRLPFLASGKTTNLNC